MTKQITLIVGILIIIGAAIFIFTGDSRPAQTPVVPVATGPNQQPANQSPPATPTATNGGPVALQPPTTPAPSAPQATSATPAAPPITEPAVKEFTITAKRFTFDPAQIRVKLNDRVRLKVTSVDVTHGISIPQFNVSEVLPPNETKTIEFIADKQGTFPFACSVYCGEGHSDMKGSLVVQ